MILLLLRFFNFFIFFLVIKGTEDCSNTNGSSWGKSHFLFLTAVCCISNNFFFFVLLFQNILNASEFFAGLCCRWINSLNLSRCILIFHGLVLRDLTQYKQNIQSFHLFPWIKIFCLLKRRIIFYTSLIQSRLVTS